MPFCRRAFRALLRKALKRAHFCRASLASSFLGASSVHSLAKFYQCTQSRALYRRLFHRSFLRALLHRVCSPCTFSFFPCAPLQGNFQTAIWYGLFSSTEHSIAWAFFAHTFAGAFSACFFTGLCFVHCSASAFFVCSIARAFSVRICRGLFCAHVLQGPHLLCFFKGAFSLRSPGGAFSERPFARISFRLAHSHGLFPFAFSQAIYPRDFLQKLLSCVLPGEFMRAFFRRD